MEPPLDIQSNEASVNQTGGASRSHSFSSQKSNDSHTAAEFISTQLKLEAEAREVLPYSIDTCTKPLGSLRQILFACLTCNPAPSNVSDPYNPAGVCYSCSIQCHGEHNLVELFNKRNFTCDCGTTRFLATSPCSLRINSETNTKGNVHSEAPELKNKYNHNFRNRFCGCGCDYDAYKEKGTMFQCLGLGGTGEGGCGEDWWHPGCITGLGPNWYESMSNEDSPEKSKQNKEGTLESITEVVESSAVELTKDGTNEKSIEVEAPVDQQEDKEEEEEEDPPLPPGFPNEDEFEGFICYKCVDANPWIKRYAGAPGFLSPVFKRSAAPSPEREIPPTSTNSLAPSFSESRKRKQEDDDISTCSSASKRIKGEEGERSTDKGSNSTDDSKSAACKLKALPKAPDGQVSLFFTSDFRDHLCHCSDCFPELAKHPQLLEEEETYEPPVSEDGDEGGSTVGSGSIYDRGESALKNVDRVRAIEGVMAYNHLKDKLKPFFQKFAESGQAISADDIKEHFAKIRGDEQAIKDAGEGAKADDNRKEQGGC
ncbi:putative metaphase-anaphase transition protein [Botrytis fragariae]|uniref:Putative metaphase-anaphase transition protein n=1 Tax=Botrytis fragariae TaxID=1964551 RepID=A0A8H6AW46_9HELO|nr:putative metaphase-anaphase transition protein [Botrytis fragariae]KAF5874824.1 putative metaphase-anaphase transition protein [Botrytis fragariae]